MPVILSAILSIFSNVIGGITEEQKTKIALALQQNEEIADLLKAQANIDANEANSSNLFVSGWRPLVGWVCALAFMYQYLIYPICSFLTIVFHRPDLLQQMQSLHFDGALAYTLNGMLGLGMGLRSFEKYNNVQNNH